MDRQGLEVGQLLRVRWDGIVAAAAVPAPAWFGLRVEDGQMRFDPATASDAGWRALGARLLERATAGRHGPVGVVDGAAGPEVLVLGVDAAGWELSRAAAGPDPGHLRLLGRLRQGAAALLRHELRSPLVRLQGAVTLTARAARRPGTATAVLGELAEVERALQDQLDAADTAAEAIAGLVTPAVVDDVDGDAFLSAVADARHGTVPREDGGWAPERAATGRRGGRVTVVVPRPRAPGVAAVARLLDHVATDWPSQAGRLVVPGAVSSWPATTATGAARGVPPGPDPEFDLRLARRWAPTRPALRALRDACALEAMGVVVAFDDAATWSQLRLRPDGAAEVTGPPTEPASLAPLLRSVPLVAFAGDHA